MKYVKAYFSNGYASCVTENIFEYPDTITEEEINIDLAVELDEYAENYAYCAFGWDGDYTEEEYDDYLADCSIEWDFIDKDDIEDFDDYDFQGDKTEEEVNEETDEKTESIIFDEVMEYNEEYPVELLRDPKNDVLCVVATNEGGYNSTWVDAEQLYKALKEYFGD